MSNPVRATLIHTLAVALAIALAIVGTHLVGGGSDVTTGALALALIALEKLIRASNAFPIGDYVNGDSKN